MKIFGKPQNAKGKAWQRHLFCASCTVVPHDERGGTKTYCARDPAATLHTLERHKNGEKPHLFDNKGLRSIYYPFCADFPHTTIFSCIAPDILHQLLKRVFKDHLIPWITSITTEAEVDARFRAMSKYQGLRHFSGGISGVSQWTGKEVKQMQQVFICVIASLINEHVLAAMRGLLDFIYYAQYHSHTDITLSQMQTALDTFMGPIFMYL